MEVNKIIEKAAKVKNLKNLKDVKLLRNNTSVNGPLPIQYDALDTLKMTNKYAT